MQPCMRCVFHVLLHAVGSESVPKWPLIECVQAACYMMTLVGLKVTTLSACLQTISRTT